MGTESAALQQIVKQMGAVSIVCLKTSITSLYHHLHWAKRLAAEKERGRDDLWGWEGNQKLSTGGKQSLRRSLALTNEGTDM